MALFFLERLLSPSEGQRRSAQALRSPACGGNRARCGLSTSRKNKPMPPPSISALEKQPPNIRADKYTIHKCGSK